MKFKNLIIAFVSILSIFLFMPEVHAQGVSGALSGNVGAMFANGTASFEALIRLVKIVAYIMGIFLVMGSIFKFSQLGSNSNPPVTPKTPIVMFLAGIGIFALIGTVSIATQTLAMGSGPGDILVTGGAGWTAQTQSAMTGVLTFIRLIGYVAFIRGWLLINQFGQGKEGTLGRGITHIFGGVACINITAAATILANTFAPGVPMPF